jgi:serine/threonine protein kinase
MTSLEKRNSSRKTRQIRANVTSKQTRTDEKGQPIQDGGTFVRSGDMPSEGAASPLVPDEQTYIRPTNESQADVATQVVDADGGLVEPRPIPFEESGDLAAGAIVKDRFVIEGLLGRGGMGVVYRARDLRKEETQDRDPYVALKVLGESFRRDQRMVIAMQREARKAQTLAHPTIATVYDFDRDGDLVFLTMEMLQGDPLDEFIKKHPQGVGVDQARNIIRGLCLGLSYAHNKNIIHSDFKPGNVFLTADNRTKILDFGIARAAPVSNLDEDSQQTQFDAGTLGALTPAYASCEMFEGKEPHPADDVYALAVVSYQLLTGRHPFDFKPAYKARSEQLAPEPIRTLKRREWRAIERGLAFDRDARSGHASAFLKDFEGSPRIRLTLAAVATALALTTGYLVYEESRKVIDNRPEVSFASLPEPVQRDFEQRLQEGHELRSFSDYASALRQYQEAYLLHPKNPRAVRALEDLFAHLDELTRNDPAAEQRQIIAENLAALRAVDPFLANRPALKALAARLAPAP